MVAHSSVTSSKPKVELDFHANTCVVGDICLVFHLQLHPKQWPQSAKTVDAEIGY